LEGNCRLSNRRARLAGIVNMSRLKGMTVIYIYPMSGEGDSVLPDNWDSIPGARGCTPQGCSFRDHQHELAD
jgi:peroxiredoxin